MREPFLFWLGGWNRLGFVEDEELRLIALDGMEKRAEVHGAVCGKLEGQKVQVPRKVEQICF